MFATVDGNKNGSLTLAEVKVMDAAITQADFDKYDANKNASLSQSEYAKLRADLKKAEKAPS